MGKRSRQRRREEHRRQHQARRAGPREHQAPPEAHGVGTRLAEAVAGAWRRGWQPADLRRAVSKRGSAAHASLLVEAIALDAVRYRDHPDADPRWLAQLAVIGAEVRSADDVPLLVQWAARQGRPLTDAVALAADLLVLVAGCGSLPPLAAPPDEWGGPATHRLRAAAAAGHLDPKIVARVQALLAKAESTTFVEEAEALTAKAHELITRHAIDQAMLAHDRSHGHHSAELPEGRRVLIDDPYASAKSQLLAEIGGSGRCEVVWHPDFGFATAFGFPADLDAVELLFASLLVQATAALLAEARQPGSHTRSRGFRHSFLTAFAVRIGQRLREAAAHALHDAEVEHGANLLPVLASRDEAVTRARDEAFPRLRHHRVSAQDPAGWVAGKLAADRASLASSSPLSAGPG